MALGLPDSLRLVPPAALFDGLSALLRRAMTGMKGLSAGDRKAVRGNARKVRRVQCLLDHKVAEAPGAAADTWQGQTLQTCFLGGCVDPLQRLPRHTIGTFVTPVACLAALRNSVGIRRAVPTLFLSTSNSRP